MQILFNGPRILLVAGITENHGGELLIHQCSAFCQRLRRRQRLFLQIPIPVTCGIVGALRGLFRRLANALPRLKGQKSEPNCWCDFRGQTICFRCDQERMRSPTLAWPSSSLTVGDPNCEPQPRRTKTAGDFQSKVSYGRGKRMAGAAVFRREKPAPSGPNPAARQMAAIQSNMSEVHAGGFFSVCNFSQRARRTQ